MQSDRTKVRRIPNRASYEEGEVFSILDVARICHLGFTLSGQPYVIPTIHTRIGRMLYVHGAPASRMLKTLEKGAPVCLTVTLVDGLVLAKSAFHHSMNYRSVVVLGRAVAVKDRSEKLAAFKSFVEDTMPGRWRDCRQPNDKEIDSTSVLRIPIEEASAKVRKGAPVDDADDMNLPHWSGVVPLSEKLGEPEPACLLALPEYLRQAPLVPH